jgi:hypothetical protein
MTVKTTKKANDKVYVYYVCSTHKHYKNCKNISINGTNIEKHVLLSIRKQIEGLLSSNDIAANIGLEERKARKKTALEDMIEKSKQSIKECNEYLTKSCTHMLDGIITKQEYEVFRNEFLRKIESSENHIAHLQCEIEHLDDDTRSRELIEHFKAHNNITELNRRIVVGFLHSIIVYSNKELEVCLRYDSEFSGYTAANPTFAEGGAAV